MTISTPDWVACLDSGIDGFIFSGSYDGSISIHKHSGEEIVVSKVHDGPVKGISVARILEESGSDHLLCVTGSQDGTLKLGNPISINQ